MTLIQTFLLSGKNKEQQEWTETKSTCHTVCWSFTSPYVHRHILTVFPHSSFLAARLQNDSDVVVLIFSKPSGKSLMFYFSCLSSLYTWYVKCVINLTNVSQHVVSPLYNKDHILTQSEREPQASCTHIIHIIQVRNLKSLNFVHVSASYPSVQFVLLWTLSSIRDQELIFTGTRILKESGRT